MLKTTHVSVASALLLVGAVIAGCSSSGGGGTFGDDSGTIAQDGGGVGVDSGHLVDSATASDTSTATDTGTTVDSGGGVCDPVLQTGCQPTEKCRLAGTPPAPICVANGTQATGAVCGTANVDDCAKGNICTADATGATRACHQFCNADADCKQPAVPAGATPEAANVAHCLISLTGTAYKVCTIACNPATVAGASGCPGALSCVAGGTSAIPELTNCSTPGAGAEASVCTKAGDCATGLTCVGAAAGTSHCRAICRAGTNADCTTGGYTCATGGTMFGFCCPAAGC